MKQVDLIEESISLYHSPARSGIFYEGIDCPRRQRGGRPTLAKNLIKFRDLKFVLDQKWVAAQVAPVITEVKTTLELTPANFFLGRLRYSLKKPREQAVKPTATQEADPK